jgi:phage terminase large subunit GpA-like protein
VQAKPTSQKLIKILEKDDFLFSDIKPSKWAEEHRVMTTEVSAFPGPFKYDRTPYLREVVDTLRPDHPAKRIAVMKGAQIGFSTGVIENGVGYLMSEHPCNILIAARDEGLMKDMMDKKIDQMINSCGLHHMLGPNNPRARNMRTGDTSTGKEFAGGSIRGYSIQKPGKMRQVSVQVGFLDDFEAAPVDKDAGSAEKLFQTRFASYYNSMKLFFISTPEVKHSSNIEPVYLKGDQRKWHVPCPKCGDYIVIEWRTTGRDGKRAGILYDYDDEGELIDGSVRYKCQSCAGEFTDGHKYEMNLNGKWIPTARQKDPTFFSYHISALYAPPGS